MHQEGATTTTTPTPEANGYAMNDSLQKLQEFASLRESPEDQLQQLMLSEEEEKER